MTLLSPSMLKRHDVSVLLSAAEIRKRLESMAAEIAKQFTQDLMIVSLLRGSFVFTADMIRELYAVGCHPQIDFMTLSSYGSGMTSSQNVTIHRDINEEVKGRHVLILDDILESGRTLFHAREILKERGAEMIKIGVLLEKPGKRAIEIEADYVGFTIPDKFVVGYGLDYANYYRELPYVGVIEVH